MQVFFTPLSQALRLMIHLGEPLPEARLNEFHFDFSVLGLFFLLPYALMMWTNGVGASTGMFVPALAVGATGVFLCGHYKTEASHRAETHLSMPLQCMPL